MKQCELSRVVKVLRESEAAIAIIARTDLIEQESVVLLNYSY